MASIGNGVTTLSNNHRPDPELDLLLERVVDVPRDLVWAAWTMPEHLVRWFAPAPFTTTECDIDLRPGGIFRTVLRSPDGEEFLNTGCYLDVVENERLVWTSVLLPGYRPASPRPELAFTAVISLEGDGRSTKYSALAMHGDSASRENHAEQGFHEGWGTALDQLVASFGPSSQEK
jgi:uncharacterized protein YndB with AHSA1/START domain